jgi:hypothetical protein
LWVMDFSVLVSSWQLLYCAPLDDFFLSPDMKWPLRCATELSSLPMMCYDDMNEFCSVGDIWDDDGSLLQFCSFFLSIIYVRWVAGLCDGLLCCGDYLGSYVSRLEAIGDNSAELPKSLVWRCVVWI